MKPSIGIILRQSVDCPRCDKPLRLRPDAALAATLLAMGGGTVLGSMLGQGAWVSAAATFACTVVLFAFFVLAIVRFLPMRHVQASDAAASSYRVLIVLMLLFCALVVAFAFGARHGA
jgi:hypothetical protein